MRLAARLGALALWLQAAALFAGSPEARPLRVASFNVHFGAHVPELATAILANPRLHDADVILLQEIESYPGDDRPAELARRLGLRVVYAAARPKRQGTHGLAILSRLPLRDVEVLPLRHYELGWGNRRRIALAATLDWNGAPVRIVDVHLDTRLTLDQRREQMRPVLAWTARHRHVVVGGDMNTLSCLGALLPGVPLLLPGIGQSGGFDDFMAGQGWTVPLHHVGHTGPLGQRLDAVFARGMAAGASAKEAGVHVSDHLPVWADFDGLAD
jgi:endonuclease/exonuclease/phosphatase family metal-dependent hydrolase